MQLPLKFTALLYHMARENQRMARGEQPFFAEIARPHRPKLCQSLNTYGFAIRMPSTSGNSRIVWSSRLEEALRRSNWFALFGEHILSFAFLHDCNEFFGVGRSPSRLAFEKRRSVLESSSLASNGNLDGCPRHCL